MLDFPLQDMHNKAMRQKFTSASCPNSGTLFEHLPVEYDEDGGYAALETRPFADPGCGKRLCACGNQSQCDGCEEAFCVDHLLLMPRGRGTALRCCPTCPEETEPSAVVPVPQYLELATARLPGGFIDEMYATQARDRSTRAPSWRSSALADSSDEGGALDRQLGGA